LLDQQKFAKDTNHFVYLTHSVFTRVFYDSVTSMKIWKYLTVYGIILTRWRKHGW